MPIRPVDVQGAVQQSGGAASQHAARFQAPAAAQAQAEAAEPERAARRQVTVRRSLKGEAQKVGERPTGRDPRQQTDRQPRRRTRHAAPDRSGRAEQKSTTSPPDGKGRVLDVRL